MKRRKRRIVTDMAENMLEAIVHEAGIQDRDGAPALIESVRDSYPTLTKIFADGGYAGQEHEARPDAARFFV